MKRLFNDEGEICNDEDLREATEYIQLAYQKFKEAGYLNRDFFQWAELEASLMLYDDQIEKHWGINDR